MADSMTSGSEITLPPTSRYLGSRITITRTGGLTATGRLIAVAEEGIELELDDGTVTVAPYATTTTARLAEAAEQIHGHMPPVLDVEAVLADPAGACPDCVRIVIGQLSDAIRLAESDGDAARRDLTGAYTVLTDATPGRPASATAAADKAVRMIRDRDAERRRALDERDDARAELTGAYRGAEELRGMLRDRTAERDAAREQVKRVRAVHAPHDCNDSECPQRGNCDACDEPIPCTTERALDGGRVMSTPLVRYMDAVVQALLDAGIGVRDHCADDRHPRLISIDLDPVSAVRRPTVLWTASTGWRIAMLCRGQVRIPTLRYLAAGPVPYPSEVAEQVREWLDDPFSFTAVQPVYDTVPHLIAKALAEAASAARP